MRGRVNSGSQLGAVVVVVVEDVVCWPDKTSGTKSQSGPRNKQTRITRSLAAGAARVIIVQYALLPHETFWRHKREMKYKYNYDAGNKNDNDK